MTFTEFGLDSSLIDLLNTKGYTQPYPIQQQAIPAILKGWDILGIAKTGSGKTASYVLPILTQLQSFREIKNRHIQVLVLVPTRELAVQVNEVFREFSKNLPKPVKSLAVFGGVSINPQMIDLQGVEVLVATPGRLLELAESKAVHFAELKTLVINGEYPEFFACRNCGTKEHLTGFSIFHDGILCKDCAKVSKDVMEINGSTLYALQYIVYSDIKNLFTFVVSDEVLTEMKMVMARCMHAYVDKKMNSLEILDVLD